MRPTGGRCSTSPSATVTDGAAVTVRVRFAPSPTGYLHVGSARTALFNWIFARATGGTMLLRIEDTDASRNQPELVTNILDALTWLGIDWDEGPEFQSANADRHRAVIEDLLAAGHAYVDDGAVRLRVPEDGVTGWDDVVRGRIEFDNANVEDFVIRRSDGSPTFLLANAVDDVDAGITHVIRGEDMINNMPKQLLLLDALGARGDVVYAHLPLLVDEQRRKLSKRFGDVAVERYRERGIVAPAMANYLALLGWSPGDDVEIRPMAEIVERFRLEDVNASSAFFDVRKLTHVNATYLRVLEPAAFRDAAAPFCPHPLATLPDEFVRALQERTQTLADVEPLVAWLFAADPVVDPDAWERAVVGGAHATTLLDGALAAYADAPWEAAELHRLLAELGESVGLKLGKAQAPIRVAVTGTTVGPPLFESLEVLGRERTLARLRAARARL